MFFHQKIKSIKPSDKVLEIGPGGTPHPRADVFLDIDPSTFPDEESAGYQRGNAPKLSTNKPLVFYDGKRFPFEANEFDYVICTHVLEHVDDLKTFLAEMFRVAKKGYVEYPTIYYEYLYSIPVHLNILRKVNNTLLYLKKSDTNLSDFQSVQKLFLDSLGKGHSKLVDDLQEYMFEGFEWHKPFMLKKSNNLSAFSLTEYSLPMPSPPDNLILWQTRIITLQIIVIKRLFKKIFRGQSLSTKE